MYKDHQTVPGGESWLAIAFERASVGIAIVATDGHWLRVNPRLCEIVGYSQEELLAGTFLDITHPDDLASSRERMRRILAHETGTYTAEKRFIRGDGTVVWANITIALVDDAQGAPDYFIAVIEDIQSRKQAEAALRKFSRVIEQTASTVVLTNDQGVIEYVNPRFTETSGYTAEEAIGQRPSLLKSGHTSLEEYAQLWQTITAGGVWRGEFHNRRKDGSLFWESAIISPIRDEHDRITHYAGIKDDITAEKRIASELQNSQRRLQLLFDHAPAALAMFDHDLRFLMASHRWLEDYGLEDTEIIGRSVYEVFPDMPERWRAVRQRALAGEVIRNDEDRYERADGSVQWLRWEVRPWQSNDGVTEGIVIFTEDITERKEAELAVAEHEAMYRAVVESSADGFWMLDREGRIRMVNEAYVRRSGYSREELLSMHVSDLDAQESPGEVRDHLTAVLQNGSDLFETVHRTRSGELWPVEVNVSYIDISGGLFFTFSRDISGRKLLERQIIEASTAEQERLGREIHDGIGQQLTGLAMLADSIQYRLRSAGQATEAAAVAELKGHLQDALGEVRALARGLSPVEIDPDGLTDALEKLADRVTQTSGIECRYHGTGGVRVHDGATALHLFRLAQEAVQNAVRHGSPTRIDIRLMYTRQGLELIIQDNGRGLGSPFERSSGLGLQIMQYRAGILGGKCVIRNVESGGVLVHCIVPLRDRNDGA